MKTGSKYFLYTSLLYGITGAFPSVINIIILPFIEGPSKLSAIDFSQIAIIETIVVFAWLIASFSGSNVIARYYYEYIDKESGLNKFVSTFFISILFRSAVVFAIFFFLGDLPGKVFNQPELNSFSSYGPIAVLIGMNRSLNTALTALLRNQKKTAFYVGFNVFAGLLRGAGQIAGLFYIEMSYIGYLYGILFSSLITGAIILIYIFFKYGIHYNRSVFKTINKFAFSIFYYELVLWIMTYIDRFLLEKYPVDLGLYETIARFALGIRIIIQGFNNAVQPEIYGYLKSGANRNENSLSQSTNIFMALSQCIIIFSIIPVMIYLFYFCDSNIKEAYNFVPIIMVTLILKSQFMFFSLPVLYYKDTKVFLRANIFAAFLTIGLNVALIPYIKIYAPIIAILVSDFFIMAVIMRFEKTNYKIKRNYIKLVYYPLALIFIAIILEVLKLSFNINPFVSAAILVSVFIVQLSIIYWTELKMILKKKLV